MASEKTPAEEAKEFWDELVKAVGFGKKQRAGFEFEEAENGCMEETRESMKLRIAEKWGFDPARVVPMEADMKAMFELGRTQFNVYSSVRFQVNGKGWATDFEQLWASAAYDDEKKED